MQRTFWGFLTFVFATSCLYAQQLTETHSPTGLKSMIDGVDNIGICVADLKKSVEFYQALGFTKAYENARPEHRSKITVLDLAGECLAVTEAGGEHGEIGIDHPDEVRDKFKTYARTHFRDDSQCLGVLSQLEELHAVADIGDLVSAAVVAHD